jgi:outer membrane biosynthesis protein TonB
MDWQVADDGKIIGVKLEKSSRVKEWDEAVLKAVMRPASVPLYSNGKAPNLIID